MSYDVQGVETMVGFTAPSVIYEKMRQVNTSATSFDADVKNVERDLFKKAWEAWFTNWKAFFEKHQSQMQRLGNVFFTDELDAQAESYRKELLSFMATYDRELKQTGEPLPPRATSEPSTPSPAPEGEQPPKGGIMIPWWGWMLGGAALTVGAYYSIRRMTGASSKVQYVVVPQAPAYSTTALTPPLT